jgi:NRAMP (natural resistance-associated macrophage protein)-like metal ion transporter
MRKRSAAAPHSHNPLVRYFRVLGPGLVTGAADDDPSGIAAYSAAGASVGHSMLWTAWVTYPLMAAIQLTCARIGMVTGQGLAAAIRVRYPRPFLLAACVVLLGANVFNIGADLAGMADVMEMVTGLSSHVFVPIFGLGMLVGTVYLRYAVFARFLKWLTATLFAYVITAFLARPDWPLTVRATFVPSVVWERDWLATLLGVLGTTISPYLFFWQASQEVEEERAIGRSTLAARRGATAHELGDARIDVNTGMFFSNVIMYFIMLTTASTLHRAGVDEIETSRQAAEALRPLAGEWAYLVFAAGIVGTGLLSVPVLAGSASFAVAELFSWPSGLDLRPRQAWRFYLTILVSFVAGMAFDLFGLNPIRLLVFSAVLNGLLAPPLMILVMLVANDRAIMGEHVNGFWLNALGWTATALMTAAAVAYLLSLGT